MSLQSEIFIAYPRDTVVSCLLDQVVDLPYLRLSLSYPTLRYQDINCHKSLPINIIHWQHQTSTTDIHLQTSVPDSAETLHIDHRQPSANLHPRFSWSPFCQSQTSVSEPPPVIQLTPFLSITDIHLQTSIADSASPPRFPFANLHRRFS